MSINIHIKTRDIELTEALREYIEKRLEALQKFFLNEEGQVYVEVHKVSNHHKRGEVFCAEIDVKRDGQKFHIVSKKDNLYSAIDDAQDELLEEITYSKDRKDTLVRRGARSIKKMFKGLSKRNPFTSKY